MLPGPSAAGCRSQGPTSLLLGHRSLGAEGEPTGRVSLPGRPSAGPAAPYPFPDCEQCPPLPGLHPETEASGQNPPPSHGASGGLRTAREQNHPAGHGWQSSSDVAPGRARREPVCRCTHCGHQQQASRTETCGGRSQVPEPDPALSTQPPRPVTGRLPGLPATSCVLQAEVCLTPHLRCQAPLTLTVPLSSTPPCSGFPQGAWPQPLNHPIHHSSNKPHAVWIQKGQCSSRAVRGVLL